MSTLWPLCKHIHVTALQVAQVSPNNAVFLSSQPSRCLSRPLQYQIKWFGFHGHVSFLYRLHIVAMPNVSFQCLLAPIILAECLHARLQDSIAVLTSILDDTPTAHQPVRLALIEGLRFLEDAAHQLRFCRLVLMLTIQQNLSRHIRVNHSLPAIEDLDDSSDSEPWKPTRPFEPRDKCLSFYPSCDMFLKQSKAEINIYTYTICHGQEQGSKGRGKVVQSDTCRLSGPLCIWQVGY